MLDEKELLKVEETAYYINVDAKDVKIKDLLIETKKCKIFLSTKASGSIAMWVDKKTYDALNSEELCGEGDRSFKAVESILFYCKG